jgi:hypothetical protein
MGGCAGRFIDQDELRLVERPRDTDTALSIAREMQLDC